MKKKVRGIPIPKAMLGMVGNEQLDAIAEEAKERLQRVIAVLEHSQ